MSDLAEIHSEVFRGETLPQRPTTQTFRGNPAPASVDFSRKKLEGTRTSPPPLAKIEAPQSPRFSHALGGSGVRGYRTTEHISRPLSDDQAFIFEHFCKFSFMRSYLSRIVPDG